MNQYKYDTHIHTSEVSYCGIVDGASVARLYKEAGYDGIVITDHFFSYYFNRLQGSWQEKIDAYLEGYRNAFREGQKLNLKVILGLELRFVENENDYLVYGIDEGFLRNHENLFEVSLEKFVALTKNSSVIIYQAHPFRSTVSPANPAYLDGVEVYNGNPRQNSMNHKALEFAEKNNLRKLSGSDFHQSGDLALGGIVLPEAPANSFEFAEMLRNNRVLRLIERKKYSFDSKKD